MAGVVRWIGRLGASLDAAVQKLSGSVSASYSCTCIGRNLCLLTFSSAGVMMGMPEN